MSLHRFENPDLAQANERCLVIAELEGGVRLVVDLADHAIGLPILRGRFELNELDFVRRTVRPGQHVVDAGAHVGYFAMHMAALVGAAGTVHCFEPFEPNADCLARAVRENRFEDRVVLERVALGDRKGRGELVCARGPADAGAGFVRAPGAPVPEGCVTHPVDVMALDECRLPRPIGFLRMDIEGAEPLALRGAAGILAEDRPVILVELHPLRMERIAGVRPDALIRDVTRVGYRCHLLGAGVPGAEVHDTPTSGVTPVVFMPT